MRPRIALARGLARMGRPGQALAAAVLRASDAVELNRRHYAQPEVMGLLANESYVDSGLTAGEEAVLERCPPRPGRLLDLGAGGGREAIALCGMGFEVTCVDYSSGLCELTRKHAARHGLGIEALCREVDALDLAADSFDVAWLGSQMYSSLPGSRARVRMLRGVAEVLKPGGLFLCEGRWHPSGASRLADLARGVAAVLCLGRYEPGDQLLGRSEFAHAFRSEARLTDEFERAGFEVADLVLNEERRSGWAILRKPA